VPGDIQELQVLVDSGHQLFLPGQAGILVVNARIRQPC
jgi:hypothetical protein